MRRIISLIIILTLLITLTFLSCKKKEEVIKIGAILPLTGGSAQWGIPPMRGAQLAVEKINEKGGIKGKKISLLVEDTRCEPKDGVSAINKLIANRDLKVVLGAVCSGVTLAVAPIAERNKVILISPASTNQKITHAGDFIFRVIPSDDLRGKVFAEYMFKDAGIKSVAILYINNESGVGNKDSFSTSFIELGGKILIEETFEQGATDMRTQLTKIKSINVEAIMIVSFPSDTPLIMKQAKELGLAIPLYFQTEAVEDPNVLREAGNASEGAIYILPAPAEGKVTNEFVALYEGKYASKPELFAAEAYDIINIIADAINFQDDNLIDYRRIRDYLYSVKNYPGASGTITFDRNGDVIKPMAIKMIRNGEPINIKKR